MSNILEDLTGQSAAERLTEEAQGAANRAALAAMGLAFIPPMFQPVIPGHGKSALTQQHYKFKQVRVVPGVTLGPLTIPLKTVDGPASPAPAALPLAMVDVPTASYLEIVEDQAIKQQKALAYQVKGSGIVSEQQAQELAMAAPEKPADLTWVIIVGVLGLILFGRKLWR